MIVVVFYVVRWSLDIVCNSDVSLPPCYSRHSCYIFPLIVFARFTCDNETRSVVQYFLEKHKIALQFTSLPALEAGTEERRIYLPMEVL